MTKLEIHYEEHAEKMMIGCIVGSPDVLDEFPMTEEWFWHYGSKMLFQPIDRLHKAGQQISISSVIGLLTKKQLEHLGGLMAVKDAFEYVPRSSAPALYETLSKALQMRRIKDVTTWADANTRTPFDSVGECEEFCREFAARVSAIPSDADSENILTRCADEVMGKIDRMNRGEMVAGFQTFLPQWNAMFGGIPDGQYIAIAGRPGTGKTALMEQFIADYVAAGKPVAMFEKDMAPVKLIERIACRAAHVSYRRFQRCQLNAEEIEAVASQVREIKAQQLIRLYSPMGLTAEKLCSIVRREQRQTGIAAVFLDHIATLDIGNQDTADGLTRASALLRANVTETGLPHVVLAHLNRESKKTGGRPSAETIKGFDGLYGDVDGMLLLWLDSPPDEYGHRTVNLFAAKNREGGETESTAHFDGPMMSFVPYAEDGQ